MKVHCRQHWRAASTPIVSRGLAKEGESRRADKGGLGGPGNFTRNIQEGIQRRYLEGGGGGRWVTLVRGILRGLQTVLE